jgi:hypothetical protein
VKRIWKHIENWVELYGFFPLGVLAIIGAPHLVHFMTDRKPAESVDWVVDYSAVSMKALLIVLFVSIMKQATGTWLTKEEKLAHPYISTLGAVTTLATFYGFLWLFSH